VINAAQILHSLKQLSPVQSKPNRRQLLSSLPLARRAGDEAYEIVKAQARIKTALFLSYFGGIVAQNLITAPVRRLQSNGSVSAEPRL
jgi:hypothetical protein